MRRFSPLAILLFNLPLLMGSFQERPALGPGIRLFPDPLIEALYRHYHLTDPNADLAGKVIIKYEDLCAPLKTIIEQSKTEPLEELLETCSTLLSPQARQLEWYIRFFPPPAAQIEREKLSALLDQAEPYLKIAARALNDLNNFLDWYPGADWQKRFGDTGFFIRLRQLKQNAALMHSMLIYYRAACYGPPPFTANYNADLDRALKTLQNLLDSHEQSDAPAPLFVAAVRLWQARLARAAALYRPQNLDQALQYLQQAQQTSLPPELTGAVCLEALRIAAQDKNEDLLTFKARAEDFRKWIDLNQNQLPDYPLALLECALLQISLDPQPAGAPLAPLKQLAQTYPQLHSVISYLMGGYLSQTFETAADADQIALFGDDFDLLAWAYYYQYQSPCPYDKAIRAYEIYLQTRPPANSDYPRVLYDAGLCAYRFAQSAADRSAAETSSDYLIAALDYWHRLARDFPGWRSTADLRLDAPRVAAQAAALVCDLYADNPELYTNLALEVLPTLVGRIDADSAVPRGPYAQTEPAIKCRYYYALVLHSARQYQRAADMFAAVVDEDENKPAARYYHLLCGYLHYEQTNTPQEERAVLYQTLVHQLDSQTGPGDARCLTLALDLLQKLRPQLLQLHARDQKQQLLDALARSLPVARAVYKNLNSSDKSLPLDDENKLSPLVPRILLEQLCLAAAAAADLPASNHLLKTSQLSKEADELIAALSASEKYARTLWFVRSRALLEFARGRYDLSQQLWFQVRTAAAQTDDQTNQYYWWEARYFGLCCLRLQGQTAQADHALDLLLRNHPPAHPDWLKRLQKLR